MPPIRVIRLRRRTPKHSWGFTIRHTLILPISNTDRRRSVTPTRRGSIITENNQCATNDNAQRRVRHFVVSLKVCTCYVF
jgi:hypothetical protein